MFPLFQNSQLPISQVLSQLSCGDTCEMLIRLKWYSRYFYKIRCILGGEINEPSLSNRHPVRQGNADTRDTIAIEDSNRWLEVAHSSQGYLIFHHTTARHHLKSINIMMTSSNGNIFRVTGHLCGEFTGPRWIPCTKASDVELWYFLWSAPE